MTDDEQVRAAIDEGLEYRRHGEIYGPQDWSHAEQLKHIMSVDSDKDYGFDWWFWGFIAFCGCGIFLLLVLVVGFFQWVLA